MLEANGIGASFGGNGYLYAPHVLLFRAGFTSDDDAGERLLFETLGIRLSAGLDEAAPLILTTALRAGLHRHQARAVAFGRRPTQDFRSGFRCLL
ncbi:hypothetical protein [Streptomyces sp. NPDC060275]|uniref:hypothetical protein n=1 Tax=Streptomyces sp. NPDC060275 TaxID=3347090 RepID=UPI00365C6DD2